MLAGWTYTDAKLREKSHPFLWAIVVTFGCFPIGLLIYILFRGSNKHSQTSNKYIKALIITFLLIFPALFFFMIGGFSLTWASQEEGFFRRNGQFHTLRHDVSEQEWTISARRADGRINRNFYLTQNDLDNLHTILVMSEGEATLRLVQINNSVSESFIIPNKFRTNIEVTQIEPGMIRKYVFFRDAEQVDLIINWEERNRD